MWLIQRIREKVHIIETKYIEFPNGWLQGTWFFISVKCMLHFQNVLQGFLWESLHLRGGVGVERSLRIRGFDPWSGHTQVVKTGTENSTAKRSLTDVSVTRPRSLLL